MCVPDRGLLEEPMTMQIQRLPPSRSIETQLPQRERVGHWLDMLAIDLILLSILTLLLIGSPMLVMTIAVVAVGLVALAGLPVVLVGLFYRVAAIR